jgi:hypothetical protein
MLVYCLPTAVSSVLASEGADSRMQPGLNDVERATVSLVAIDDKSMR